MPGSLKLKVNGNTIGDIRRRLEESKEAEENELVCITRT